MRTAFVLSLCSLVASIRVREAAEARGEICGSDRDAVIDDIGADVVSEGKGGLLFEPGNLDDAAQKLDALMRDKERGWPIFNQENVAKACSDFTAEACVQRTLEAYGVGMRRCEAVRRARIPILSHVRRFSFIATVCFFSLASLGAGATR